MLSTGGCPSGPRALPALGAAATNPTHRPPLHCGVGGRGGFAACWWGVRTEQRLLYCVLTEGGIAAVAVCPPFGAAKGRVVEARGRTEDCVQNEDYLPYQGLGTAGHPIIP